MDRAILVGQIVEDSTTVVIEGVIDSLNDIVGEQRENLLLTLMAEKLPAKINEYMEDDFIEQVAQALKQKVITHYDTPELNFIESGLHKELAHKFLYAILIHNTTDLVSIFNLVKHALKK